MRVWVCEAGCDSVVAHWDHPVGEVSVLRDLHGTEHGHVEVTLWREGGREGGREE